MSQITSVTGREILDSRGNPTVEVEVGLTSGARARAAVPSGASTGAFEAVELRDGDPNRYGGKGVLQAVVARQLARSRPWSPAWTPLDQRAIDAALIELDGTPNKGNLGANAILGVPRWPWPRRRPPTRACRCFASSAAPTAHTLPVPMMNMINGGAHADNTIDLQEFMVVPLGADSFSEALRVGAETFHALKALLHRRGLSTAVGDEGGFAPDLASSEEAIEAILEAAERRRPPRRDRDRAGSGLDASSTATAATPSRGAPSRARGWWSSTPSWWSGYPIVSIEDGLAEDDWDGWQLLTERLGDDVQLVGDDLFVTNVERLQRGIERARPTPSWSR